MTVTVTTLDNGLRVATDAMESARSVSLGVFVGVGTRNETPEINGVSHLLEHMAFKGTKRRSARAIAEEIEAVGGHINAYTSRENTVYVARVLKEDTPLALDILADILQNSVFDESELELERHVVLQEIGQCNDTPDDLIFDHFQSRAYPDQAMGRPILGLPHLVSAFSRDSLGAYMAENYAPERMVVVAAGEVDHEIFALMVAEAFDSLNPAVSPAVEPARYAGGDMRSEKLLEQLHLVLGFEGVPAVDPDYYALAVFSGILGGGMSSRLFQEVREKRGLVYTIASFTSSYTDSGMLGVYAGAAADKGSELLPVICDEIKGLGESVTGDELSRARAQARAGLLMSRESTPSRCEQLGTQMLVYGRPLSLDEITARIDAVDREAVSRVAARLLSTAPTFVTLGPGGASLPGDVATLLN